jgi:hypothetical protein
MVSDGASTRRGISLNHPQERQDKEEFYRAINLKNIKVKSDLVPTC